MKLRDTLLCLNLECEEIFLRRWDKCPVCNGSCVRLSRWVKTMKDFEKELARQEYDRAFEVFMDTLKETERLEKET